jgi:hypothetical protein
MPTLMQELAPLTKKLALAMWDTWGMQQRAVVVLHAQLDITRIPRTPEKPANNAQLPLTKSLRPKLRWQIVTEYAPVVPSHHLRPLLHPLVSVT